MDFNSRSPFRDRQYHAIRAASFCAGGLLLYSFGLERKAA
jgi:hypothetical protein